MYYKIRMSTQPLLLYDDDDKDNDKGTYLKLIVLQTTLFLYVNNYIVMSYRDVIVVNNTATKRTNKA